MLGIFRSAVRARAGPYFGCAAIWASHPASSSSSNRRVELSMSFAIGVSCASVVASLVEDGPTTSSGAIAAPDGSDPVVWGIWGGGGLGDPCVLFRCGFVVRKT